VATTCRLLNAQGPHPARGGPDHVSDSRTQYLQAFPPPATRFDCRAHQAPAGRGAAIGVLRRPSAAPPHRAAAPLGRAARGLRLFSTALQLPKEPSGASQYAGCVSGSVSARVGRFGVGCTLSTPVAAPPFRLPHGVPAIAKMQASVAVFDLSQGRLSLPFRAVCGASEASPRLRTSEIESVKGQQDKTKTLAKAAEVTPAKQDREEGKQAHTSSR
jgi:hypothetical protein